MASFPRQAANIVKLQIRKHKSFVLPKRFLGSFLESVCGKGLQGVFRASYSESYGANLEQVTDKVLDKAIDKVREKFLK